jgi:hypothetical protein
MRPKARGLTQHGAGGQPSWLENSDPAGVIIYMTNEPHRCLFRTILIALTEAALLRADGIPAAVV